MDIKNKIEIKMNCDDTNEAIKEFLIRKGVLGSYNKIVIDPVIHTSIDGFGIGEFETDEFCGFNITVS